MESILRKLQIIVLGALLLSMPLCLSAQIEHEDVETEMQAVTLSVSGTKVHVSGAEGAVLEIYNLTGVKVATHRIDSNDKFFNLASLTRGCYILKVGKVVRKVSIR